MVRRRPVDFVGWRLYRRALVVPALALLVLLVTSFRADVPVQGLLPPTLANEQASSMLDDAKEFREAFPERTPGSPDAIDSAQWMLERFKDLGLAAKTVPATTIDPATGRSVGLVNVEATLRGRTRELVVVYAHRDSGTDGRGADAVGQMALLSLAKELHATRDLRRTYLFVSTDGATLNGGGARALAERLARRGAVVAVVGVDRLGAGEVLRVDAAPSGPHAPPLGLVKAATGAVDSEGGDPSVGSVVQQLARLAAPVTLREHGQLLQHGLPALTITAGDDQLRGSGDRDATSEHVGTGVRAVQRLVGTLEQVDQLQNAGRTWVMTDQRVYRGWALKIFIASLLIPVWLASVDMLVRHRRGWNLPAAIGTSARAMLAGVAGVAALWALGAVGLLPASEDRPPNPGAIDDAHAFALVVWLLLAGAAWLLARGPDWRRQRDEARASAIGPDTPELVVPLVGLVMVSVLALSVSPYAVLFIAPALHAWMCIPSWRVVFSPARATVVWAAGFVGPLLAVLTIGARSDTGLGAPWYALQLVQTRTVPPMLALLGAAGAGLALLLLVAARGRVAHPRLPVLRAWWTALRDGQLRLSDIVPARVRETVRGQARRLRLPSATGRERPVTESRRARQAPMKVEPQPSAAERARERARARATNRRRVNSR
jgi:hypothetical protein